MQRTATAKKKQTKGLAYTFIVSLYCTLMIWSAFVSIDRRIAVAVSTATVAPISGASR